MQDDKNRRTFDPLRSKAKVALGTAAAFVAGLGIASGLGWTTTTTMPELDSAPRVTVEDPGSARALSDAFVSIAEAVTPAVVRIEAERPARTSARGFDPRDLLPEGFSPEGEPPQRRLAGGSGFIVSPDGYIMTNDHVVSGSDRVTVWLNDGRYFPSEVVGSDPFTDVAVLKIDVGDEELPTLSIGSSDEIRVGEWILAVGNPGFAGGARDQLDYTVTAGIISARNRGLNLLTNELYSDPRTRERANYAIEDFLQTDAVINPGNSGGPMVDLDGRVVGVNSAIASQTGFYQGYGFAIPIDLATRVMEDLIEYGYVKRPIIGVSIGPVDAEDAEYYELPEVSGALVQDVPEGPARRAGIQREDVIVAIEGDPVRSPNQLQQEVAQYRPGQEITVSLYRDGERREVEVTLADAELNVAAAEPATPEPAAETRLGFQVENVDAEMARQLGLERAAGVVITDVDRLSPAYRQNLTRGLLIEQIQRQPVEDADDVRRILSEVEPGEIVSIVALNPGTGQTSVYNMRMPRN